MRELRHLLESQWKNGLLPQIVFNARMRGYFPGIGFWHADRSPDSPRDRKTSGVVQPPIHATGALRVYQRATDQKAALEFLRYAFPRLEAWHVYLFRERDPGGEGLVYIRHPWESGMDNSPMWDSIMERLWLKPDQVPVYKRADTHVVAAEDRPQTAEYDRFAYLVQLFADRDYDEARIQKDCPFLVQDVLFNAVLCQADRDLAEIARIVGKDHSALEDRARRTARAMDDKLWNDERSTYLGYDVVADRHIPAHVASNIAGALYAGVPDDDKARSLVEDLHVTFGLSDKNVTAVPCYDPHGFGYSPMRYWRGPVWINIDWFLMRGLERYGHDRLAGHLRRTITELCQSEGFFEYFDPATGMGHGSDFFSWTAALLLDILLEEGDWRHARHGLAGYPFRVPRRA